MLNWSTNILLRMESRSVRIAGHHFVVENYNGDFILLHSDECPDLPLLAQDIYHRKFPFIREIIGTEKEICLKLNDNFSIDILSDLEDLQVTGKSGIEKFKLPIWFSDNEDWKELEQYTQLSREEYINQLGGLSLRLSMYGFLPGFLYLSGIPKHLCVPRKSTPSTRVSAGSIGVGGKYLGVYNYASPGGWHIIGTTPISTFDLRSEKVETVTIGSHIIIEPITEDEYRVLKVMDQSLMEFNS